MLTGHGLSEAYVPLDGSNRLFIALDEVQDLQPGGMAHNLQQ